MRHMTGSVYAQFEKPVRFYRGETMAGHHRRRVDARRDARLLRRLLPGDCWRSARPFLAAFLDPGGWGPEFTEFMDGYERTAGMWLVGEDMPRETNRVTLNTDVLDQHGQPVPNVHFDDHPNDEAMREHAWSRGEAVYEAVGATRPIAPRRIRRPTTSAPAA